MRPQGVAVATSYNATNIVKDSYTYTYPSKSGTFAMTTDIPTVSIPTYHGVTSSYAIWCEPSGYWYSINGQSYTSQRGGTLPTTSLYNWSCRKGTMDTGSYGDSESTSFKLPASGTYAYMLVRGSNGSSTAPIVYFNLNSCNGPVSGGSSIYMSHYGYTDGESHWNNYTTVATIVIYRVS